MSQLDSFAVTTFVGTVSHHSALNFLNSFIRTTNEHIELIVENLFGANCLQATLHCRCRFRRSAVETKRHTKKKWWNIVLRTFNSHSLYGNVNEFIMWYPRLQTAVAGMFLWQCMTAFHVIVAVVIVIVVLHRIAIQLNIKLFCRRQCMNEWMSEPQVLWCNDAFTVLLFTIFDIEWAHSRLCATIK